MLPKFDKDELKSNYDYLKSNTAKLTQAEFVSEKDINLDDREVKIDLSKAQDGTFTLVMVNKFGRFISKKIVKVSK